MLKDLAFGDVAQELSSTRRILDRLPDEHLSWRPHEKSMTLGALATHVVNLLGWQTMILQQAEFDLAATPPRREALGSRQELLDEFDTRQREVEELLNTVDEEALGGQWTLRSGDHVIFRRPRAVAMRVFGLSHLIHHRAQLSVYLRLLDLPVPGLYGPSADERQG